MSVLSRHLFLLPVRDDFLVYSPLNGISLLLNPPALDQLVVHLMDRKRAGEEDQNGFEELVQWLNAVSEEHVRRKSGDCNPDFLGIIPTRNCGSACVYCDFGAAGSSRPMGYSLAADAVDWYVDRVVSAGNKRLEIHFFGGEPMEAREVIEVVVHRARLLATKHQLDPVFEISTGGQFSEDDARWLTRYFQRVVLSFDGHRDIQNQQRPLKGGRESFTNVWNTARWISESSAELCIRCCVTGVNVSELPELTHWFCRNFELATLNYEILCPSDKTRRIGLYPPDPIEFAFYFQKSRQLAREYGVELAYASDVSDQPQVTSCPVGRDTAIISPDGRMSSCYLPQDRWRRSGLDLDFGVISPSGKVRIQSEKLDHIRGMVETKPRCERCFCRWSCSGGCHVGNTPPGCSSEYDRFCRQTRIISAFSLLEELEMEEQIESLLCDRSSLEKLAGHPDDRLFSVFSEATTKSGAAER